MCAEWMCDSQGELLMGWIQRRRNFYRVVSDQVVCLLRCTTWHQYNRYLCLLMWQQWHQYNRYHALSNYMIKDVHLLGWILLLSVHVGSSKLTFPGSRTMQHTCMLCLIAARVWQCCPITKKLLQATHACTKIYRKSPFLLEAVCVLTQHS